MSLIKNRLNRLSIKGRMMLIILFAHFFMFTTFCAFSAYTVPYVANASAKKDAELIGATLAAASASTMNAGKLEDIQQAIDTLTAGDHNLSEIRILDAQNNTILVSKSPFKQTHVSANSTFPIIWQPVDDKANKRVDIANRSGPIGYVVLTLATDALIDSAATAAIIRCVAFLLFCMVTAAISLWLTRGISAPIKLMRLALMAIRGRHYHQQLEVTSEGELGQLQQSINEIASYLDEYKIELESKVLARTINLKRDRDSIAREDAKKRRLIQRVTSLVEDEKKNIALEIHDEMNASLIAVKLAAQRISSMTKDKSHGDRGAEILEQAARIIELATTLYDNARHIVRSLRPEVLDLFGLEGAIRDIIETHYIYQTDCHLLFNSSGEFHALPNGLDITVYRLVQEALENVIQHAQATEAIVTLQNDAARLFVSITDNGRGFNQHIDAKGIGLISMRERTYAFHGQFEVIANEGAGTTVTAIFMHAG